jgi:hypothetical protein
MHTSAPKPPVAARIASTGSVGRPALHRVRRAEVLRPLELPVVEVDGDDRGGTGELARPAIAASPTPPQPNTATLSPRPTLPVFMAAPEAGHHAAAEEAGGRRGRRRVDLGALAGRDQRLLAERADAERRRQHGAVEQRHLLGRVVGAKQYHGLPFRHATGSRRTPPAS